MKKIFSLFICLLFLADITFALNTGTQRSDDFVLNQVWNVPENALEVQIVGGVISVDEISADVVTVRNRLSVDNVGRISGDFYVHGRTKLGSGIGPRGTLDVQGPALIIGRLSVDSYASISGDTYLYGNTKLGSPNAPRTRFDMYGDAIIAGILSVDSYSSVSGDSYIYGNTRLGSPNAPRVRLDVNGNVNVSNILSIDNALIISNDLFVGRRVNIIGRTAIIGVLSVDGSVSISSDLVINGAIDGRILLSNQRTGVDNRNWAFITETFADGDFSIRESTVVGANPALGFTRFYINRNGNIGVGTTVPAVSMDVVGQLSGDTLRLATRATSPDVATSTGAAIYYNKAADELAFYNGTVWKRITLN